MNATPHRERNLLEAYFRGWSWLLLAIAATLLLVTGVLWACGATLGWADFVLPVAAIGGALVLRFYGRLSRN